MLFKTFSAAVFGVDVVVPEANAREAAVVEGIRVFGVKSLPQAVDLVKAPESFKPVLVDTSQMYSEANQYSVDMRDVLGQMSVKRALEVACAGGHNILFRPSWRGQDYARKTDPHDFSVYDKNKVRIGDAWLSVQNV